MYYDRNFHEKLQKVTLQQIIMMAEKYLKYQNTATVIVR